MHTSHGVKVSRVNRRNCLNGKKKRTQGYGGDGMVWILYHINKIIKTLFLVESIDRYLEKIVVKYYEMFPEKKMGIRNRHAKRKLIVSMTTIPRRIDKVWITIESLLRQTYKPDEIILWLSKEEFAHGVIPEKLRQQEKRGLTIRYCDNLKSYKKFYYTVLENPDAYIVTVDDDIIYAENLLECMAKTYKKNPGCIVCMRSHWILRKKERLLPYNDWLAYDQRKEFPKEPSFRNFFTGAGGTFFPMFLMNKENLLKRDIFMKIAPAADDVWLNFNAWISGVKIKNCDGVLGSVICIESSSDQGLYQVNVKKNDEQINRVLDYMGIDIKDYID